MQRFSLIYLLLPISLGITGLCLSCKRVSNLTADQECPTSGLRPHSLIMYVRVCLCVCVCVYVYIYIYIYIYTHTHTHTHTHTNTHTDRRSPGLRRGSAAACFLGLRVRIPPGGMDVCLLWVLCCQMEVFVGLITRPGESYWVWCVWVWSWSLDSEEALAH